jgi:3-mercaptopyruvate sulfurtransferase SseA
MKIGMASLALLCLAPAHPVWALGLAGQQRYSNPSGPGLTGAPQETSPDALQQMLDRGEKVLVIDVRTDDEAKSGSIPGAIHIPMDQLEARMKDVPKDVQLVFT